VHAESIDDEQRLGGELVYVLFAFAVDVEVRLGRRLDEKLTPVTIFRVSTGVL
jgi:hypothetical protein